MDLPSVMVVVMPAELGVPAAGPPVADTILSAPANIAAMWPPEIAQSELEETVGLYIWVFERPVMLREVRALQFANIRAMSVAVMLPEIAPAKFIVVTAVHPSKSDVRAVPPVVVVPEIVPVRAVMLLSVADVSPTIPANCLALLATPLWLWLALIARFPAPAEVPIVRIAPHPSNCELISALAATVQALRSILDNLSHPKNCLAWLVGAAPPDPTIFTDAEVSALFLNPPSKPESHFAPALPTFVRVQVADVLRDR